MLSLIKKLFSTKPGQVPRALEFQALDLDNVIAQLNIKGLASTAGRKGYPPSESTEPDANERAITNHINEEATYQTNTANERLSAYDNKINRINLSKNYEQCNNFAENARLVMKNKISEDLESLRQLKRKWLELDDELQRFAKENRLSRSAIYPDSRVFQISILVMLVVLESGMNGYFFSIGSQLGYIGGITQALIISLINIFPAAAFIGRLILPNLLHVSKLRRYMSAVVLPLYLGFVLLFNLLIAQYRDQVLINPDAAASQAVQNLSSSPLSLHNIDSWLLFCLGIAFALIAAIDGFKLDDPYPGYGKITRRTQEADDEFHEAKGELLHELRRLKESALDKVEDLIERSDRDVSELRSLVSLKKTLLNNFSNYMKHTESTGMSLIREYRDTNIQSRDTPAPAYFTEEWKLPHEYRLQDTNLYEDKILKEDEMRNKLPGLTEKIKNMLEDNYNRGLEAVESLDHLV